MRRVSGRGSKGEGMKGLAVFTLVGACAAALLASASAAGDIHWDVTHVDRDAAMTVIVSGCDDLVAESDVQVFPEFTHNFPVAVHLEGWVKSSPDVPSDFWTARYRVTGSGIDSAGHSFTIDGTLTNDGNGATDFFATGGSMVVRRDDGATARGAANGAANSIVYGVAGAIDVSADRCRMK
jgi:hypothetical protein